LGDDPDQKSGTPFCDFTNRCHIIEEIHTKCSYRFKPYIFVTFILFLYFSTIAYSNLSIIPKLYGELPESLFYAFIALNTIIFLGGMANLKRGRRIFKNKLFPNTLSQLQFSYLELFPTYKVMNASFHSSVSPR